MAWCFWASGQLPTVGEGGVDVYVQAQSCSLPCAATPLWHLLALAVFARWPGLLPAWLLVRNVLTAHLTLCSVLQQGKEDKPVRHLTDSSLKGLLAVADIAHCS